MSPSPTKGPRSIFGSSVDFEDLFENAPCGLILTDARFRILRANGRAARWSGREQAALTGLHVSELLSIGSRLYFETHIAPTLQMSGSISEIAVDLAGPNGAKRPVLINADERREEDGKLSAVRIAIFGAAERRRYERNLLDAKNQAEEVVSSVREASEFREQLLAILGHDLRNPLAAISSGLSLLKRERPTERAQRLIGLIEGSAVRASVLIENVLDFARGRLGGGIELKLDLQRPLTPVIEQVVAELRLIAPSREIISEIDLPSLLPVDHARVGQLVSNLLSNALTHGAEDQPVHICAAVRGGQLELSVANGGTPIPEEEQVKLFQPFVRGAARGNKEGLGLGLHISSEIAKAHGGSLAVTSDAERTRFTFRLPLNPADLEPPR